MTAFVTAAVGFRFRERTWTEAPIPEDSFGTLRPCCIECGKAVSAVAADSEFRGVDGGLEVRCPDCAGRGG